MDNYTDEQAVLYSEAGNVATITMNRPQSLNSMSLELVDGVIAAIRRGENNPDVRGMILTGAGRAFRQAVICRHWTRSTALPSGKLSSARWAAWSRQLVPLPSRSSPW